MFSSVLLFSIILYLLILYLMFLYVSLLKNRLGLFYPSKKLISAYLSHRTDGEILAIYYNLNKRSISNIVSLLITIISALLALYFKHMINVQLMEMICFMSILFYMQNRLRLYYIRHIIYDNYLDLIENHYKNL